MKIRTINELQELKTFKERFDYLALKQSIDFLEDPMEPYYRQVKQRFYQSKEWRDVRAAVTVRDNGNELGLAGYPIEGSVYIHHMNPIKSDWFGCVDKLEYILNPIYLVAMSRHVHEAVHRGSYLMLRRYEMTERKPGDTCPWLK